MKQYLYNTRLSITLCLPVSKRDWTQWFSYSEKFRYYRQQRTGVGFTETWYQFYYFPNTSIRCQVKSGIGDTSIKRKVVEKI